MIEIGEVPIGTFFPDLNFNNLSKILFLHHRDMNRILVGLPEIADNDKFLCLIPFQKILELRIIQGQNVFDKMTAALMRGINDPDLLILKTDYHGVFHLSLLYNFMELPGLMDLQ